MSCFRHAIFRLLCPNFVLLSNEFQVKTKTFAIVIQLYELKEIHTISFYYICISQFPSNFFMRVTCSIRHSSSFHESKKLIILTYSLFYLHGNICTMTTLHFPLSHSPSHTDSLSFTCASAQTDKRRDTIANREPPCVECQLRTLCLDIAPKLGHLPIDICRFAAVGALPLQ